MEFYLGKYKAKKVREIIMTDSSYCVWFIKNIKSNHKKLRRKIFSGLLDRYGDDILEKILGTVDFTYYVSYL